MAGIQRDTARASNGQIDTAALREHIQTLKLPNSCLEVAIALAGHVNSDGVSAPPVLKLVEELGYAERTVRQALGRLVAAAVLTRRTRFAKAGGQRPTEYIFHLDRQMNAPNEP